MFVGRWLDAPDLLGDFFNRIGQTRTSTIYWIMPSALARVVGKYSAA